MPPRTAGRQQQYRSFTKVFKSCLQATVSWQDHVAPQSVSLSSAPPLVPHPSLLGGQLSLQSLEQQLERTERKPCASAGQDKEGPTKTSDAVPAPDSEQTMTPVG